MIDGTNLNILQAGRQLLRAFGGVNETYGCSEAELSRALNFSSRGYPALQTRAPRRKTQEVKDVNGMYHLNGLLLCRGTTLEYTPDADEGRSGAVVLENALTDEHKALAGMGTKVLIWPDKKAFDTETGTLTDLAAKWELGDEAMTVTPCDTEGVLYHPTGVGDTEPEKPEDGQLFLKSTDDAPYGTGSVLLKYSAKKQEVAGSAAADGAHPLPGRGRCAEGRRHRDPERDAAGRVRRRGGGAERRDHGGDAGRR